MVYAFGLLSDFFGSSSKSELATSIIYQQIGGNVAKILGERFVKLFDPPKDHHPRWFPTPEMVWEKPVETLKTAGLSTRKAEYIRGLAEKFINKTITMELLSTLSDEELSKLLCSVRGIGPVNHQSTLSCGKTIDAKYHI